MAVRRLHPNQPSSFAFTPENKVWAEATIKKYPPGKQASAVIPLLMRAQGQHQGWLPEPAIRVVAEILGMAYIRVYEIATFYTQFQLSPVGKKAHVQVCGTTPCMLRGAEALKEVCRKRIHREPFHLSPDGNFSWEEVECAGACANAPMVQIFADTYEDLTPALLEKVIDGYATGKKLMTGSQIGRKASAPVGGATTLTDPSLVDGSIVGAWRKRFDEAEAAAKIAASTAAAAAKPAAPAATGGATIAASVGGSSVGVAGVTAGAAATVAAGLMSGTAAAKPASLTGGPAPGGAKPAGGGVKPTLLDAPRGARGDDLKLIWGVAEKLEKKLNDQGIWHYDQIARWTPLECHWIETHIEGMLGRIDRDRWLEQAIKLASGWRPEGNVGERPKG